MHDELDVLLMSAAHKNKGEERIREFILPAKDPVLF